MNPTALTSSVFASKLFEASPVRVRAGRPFKPILEKELEVPLRILAARLPGSRDGVYVTPEFVGSNGVADLVAVTRAEPDLQLRLIGGLPFLENLSIATIAAAIPLGRSISTEALSRRLHMSLRQVTVYCRELESMGVVSRGGSGYRRDSSVRPVGRMYGFEAKVSDWSRAMGQAVRYSGWADAAAVVLLRAPTHLDKVAGHARAMRIGLAIGSSWVVRPRITGPSSPGHAGARLLASERFVQSVATKRSGL
jgi:hypothetical protein